MNNLSSDIEKISFCSKNENRGLLECSCINYQLVDIKKNYDQYQNIYCWLPNCYLPNVLKTESIQNDINRCKRVDCQIKIKELNINESGKVELQNTCADSYNTIINKIKKIKIFIPKFKTGFYNIFIIFFFIFILTIFII